MKKEKGVKREAKDKAEWWGSLKLFIKIHRIIWFNLPIHASYRPFLHSPHINIIVPSTHEEYFRHQSFLLYQNPILVGQSTILILLGTHPRGAFSSSFFTQDTFSFLVRNTNLYAQGKRAGGEGQRPWKDIHISHLNIWIGIVIYIGVHSPRSGSMQNFWRRDDHGPVHR